MGWLVSPAVLLSGSAAGVDANPDPRLGLAATGFAIVLAAIWQRLGRGRAVEPPLAARPLALPPDDLDLELATLRAGGRAGESDASGLESRPLWVRRMEEWVGPAPSSPQSGSQDDWPRESPTPTTAPAELSVEAHGMPPTSGPVAAPAWPAHDLARSRSGPAD